MAIPMRVVVADAAEVVAEAEPDARMR